MWLLQRNLNVGRVNDKEALVRLAYQHMVPQPQRKYRATRRGLAMAAKQKKRAAALNRLNYSDTSANQTYIMYVCVDALSSDLHKAGYKIYQEIKFINITLLSQPVYHRVGCSLKNAYSFSHWDGALFKCSVICMFLFFL